MAKYTCPSCGAEFNGKKCRKCNYEHFSEEIAHGTHTHQGEPLVIDAPVRKPIPKKNPFGCEKKKRRKYPLIGLLVILFAINTLLPLARNWGLELEAMEAAASPEPMAIPEGLVILHEEGPITIYTRPDQLIDFADGLKIWVENEANQYDVFVTPKYIIANGFVMQYASLFVEASANAWGMGTLYLDEEELSDANITDLQELTFVLEVVNEDDTHLFETDPITLSTTGRPLVQETDLGGTPLIEEDGLRMCYLGYQSDGVFAKLEESRLKFYIENDTDDFLHMNSREAAVGGQTVAPYLWTDLPAHSRAVVWMDLSVLEELEPTTSSEVGELTMTVEFWDPDYSSASVKEYKITTSLVN